MCIICVIHYQTTCVTISDVHIDPQYTHTETVYLHFTYTTYPNCVQISNWGNKLSNANITTLIANNIIITYIQLKLNIHSVK